MISYFISVIFSLLLSLFWNIQFWSATKAVSFQSLVNQFPFELSFIIVISVLKYSTVICYEACKFKSLTLWFHVSIWVIFLLLLSLFCNILLWSAMKDVSFQSLTLWFQVSIWVIFLLLLFLFRNISLWSAMKRVSFQSLTHRFQVSLWIIFHLF